MDKEAELARELASKLPNQGPVDYSYPDPDKSEATPQPESGLPPETPEDPFKKYQTKQEIFKYFNVPADQIDRLSQDIDNIIDFAKRESGSSDLADIIQYLNQTERMIGSILSPARLNKVRQFVTIRNQRRVLEQKERALYA
jgi:hypothetical protein